MAREFTSLFHPSFGKSYDRLVKAGFDLAKSAGQICESAKQKSAARIAGPNWPQTERCLAPRELLLLGYEPDSQPFHPA